MRKKRKRRKKRDDNIMSASAAHGGHDKPGTDLNVILKRKLMNI